MDKRLQSNNDGLTKIVNEDGRVVPGVYRTTTGSIVFDDGIKLSAYMKQKTLIEQKDKTIEDLSSRLDTLMGMVKGILGNDSIK